MMQRLSLQIAKLFNWGKNPEKVEVLFICMMSSLLALVKYLRRTGVILHLNLNPVFPVILGTMVVTPVPLHPGLRASSSQLPGLHRVVCRDPPGHLFPVQPQEDISCQSGLLVFKEVLPSSTDDGLSEFLTWEQQLGLQENLQHIPLDR